MEVAVVAMEEAVVVMEEAARACDREAIAMQIALFEHVLEHRGCAAYCVQILHHKAARRPAPHRRTDAQTHRHTDTRAHTHTCERAFARVARLHSRHN
jgi:hypothetical protein